MSIAEFSDDEDEPRTPAQWMFDVLLLPGLILFLTCFVILGASLAIWGILISWVHILAK